MLERYARFLRAISINWLGKLGVTLATSTFFTFIFLEVAQLLGVITNAYAGLLIYLLLPLLFIVGLILIPIGWYRHRARTGKSTRELLDEQFDPSEISKSFFGSKVFLGIASLTLLNIIFLGTASSRMLHFMDNSHFCGTACHKVMYPEWITYQQSPHARVKCVECHVGEGFGNLIDSKVNGMYQMLSVTFNLYEKPIPTPVHTLRPSRETCEKCHWPDKFYGQRLRTFTHYQEDEESTPYYSSLIQKVDAGRGGSRAGIHWHIGEENQVRYTSVNDERQVMIWIDVRQPDGSFKRYHNEELDEMRAAIHEEEEGQAEGQDDYGSEEIRVLDCIDCHNRATHIYEAPEIAVDHRIESGVIDRSLPFIKREALASITANYSSNEEAQTGIERHLHGFYQREYPDVAAAKRAMIDRAVSNLQGLYQRNIHHEMNITWNTYRSLLGHPENGGCFRCHNPALVDDEGNEISSDCDLCHTILGYEEDEPFASLQAPEQQTPAMQQPHEIAHPTAVGALCSYGVDWNERPQ